MLFYIKLLVLSEFFLNSNHEHKENDVSLIYTVSED